MFAIEVEYLTGRAVATAHNRREEAEWPPHPGRLFSALVDAAFQAVSADGVTLPTDVRAALEWLERLAPPGLAAGEAQRREVLPTFVPVNDAAAPEVKPGRRPSAGQTADALAVLPDGRGKQARFFPTVLPDCPLVHFIWEDAPDADTHRPALEQLVACVPYLGHSSSLVRVGVTDAPPEATLRPATSGRYVLRVPYRGRLADLVATYNRNARPSKEREVPYANTATPKPTIHDSVFGGMLVCEIEGPFLPLSGSHRLLRAVREAMISATDQSRPAVRTMISGHDANGDASRAEHVAYVPLANVGHRHADGKVMGFALVLPRGLGRFSEDWRAIVSALAKLADRSAIGFEGYEWDVSLVGPENPRKSLMPSRYTDESRTWATVTPVLCDRFPKRDGELKAIVADSIERVVGVRPEHILVDKISRHLGVPPSYAFPNKRKPDDPPRHRVHVAVEFKHPVRGPLIVGAGRYHGLGLFRTLEQEGRR